MENSTLLSGIRVVDLTSYVAAPSCSRLLADWGAEVIKIEPPSGDVWHYWGPTMLTPANDDENPLWDIVNANKRGIAVDLRIPEGQKILHELLKEADVFLTNTRPEKVTRSAFHFMERLFGFRPF